jgi:dGTPase
MTPGIPDDRTLGPRAARADEAVRPRPEPASALSTAFQQDRDRILHTKAFRRLKHKTQVFIAPGGDHYRTRLTHTLEVSALSRTVARALALNEDLVEAIAMGHDLGHAPFGHAGEQALDRILRARYDRRFRHNEQSVRVVEVLEGDGAGLNLTEAVVDGIRHHTGSGRPATLEGQIVRIVDRIAYVNHDIEDAVRADLLRPEELPRDEIALLGQTGAGRLETLLEDMVETSRDTPEIGQSERVGAAFMRLRKFMFDRVYLGPEASRESQRAQWVVTSLFERLLADPGLLPGAEGAEGAERVTRVTDYLAGMTDRFALRVFREDFLPHEGLL